MHAASTVTPLFPTTPATPRSWLDVKPTTGTTGTTTTTTAPLSTRSTTTTTTTKPAPRLDDASIDDAPAIVAPAAPAAPVVVIEKPHPVHALLQAAADGLTGAQAELIEQARAEIIELALHVARHIVGEQVAWGAVDLQPLVDDALARLAGALDVVVHVGPMHHAAISSALAERSGVRVQLEGDFGPADLVVDSDAGSVDARLEARLGGVERAIRSSIGGGK